MRIPLLHADFEHGSYTRIAKALRKVWPHRDISLMQAQNVLGVLLGYSSQHDAQREATASLPIPVGAFSMQEAASSVAWRMFVRYSIDLLSARDLGDKLHLDELAVASFSLEAQMRRIAEENAGKGFIHDEASEYLHAREPWPEQTPALLSKGIPPYKWAIYPDRRVFLWPKLIEQIEMLPTGFAADLRQVGKLGDSADAVVSFMVDSLVPAACRPLADALASGDLSASTDGRQQWQVRWIVTGQGEVLGCCIVAAKLGGVIPRVFPADGNDVYAAIADLLCGDALPAATPAETDILFAEPVWLVDRNRLPYLKRREPGGTHHRMWDHERLQETIALYRADDGYRLAAQKAFIERGQTYLAARVFDVAMQERMLREQAVFEIFDVGASLIDAAGEEQGIPAQGNRWHDAVAAMFSDRKARVEGILATRAGVALLEAAVLATITPAEFDACVSRAFEALLPVRYEGSTEVDDDDLAGDRERAASIAKELGARVVASVPVLNVYSRLSLGYMVLVAGGEYPGSRNQWMPDAPAQDAWADQSRVLATMLVYKISLEHELNWTALYCCVAPLLGIGKGYWSEAALSMWYRSAYAVDRHLKNAGQQLRDVDDWRRVEREADQIRAAGTFLRAGDAIPAVKPRSAAEAMYGLMLAGRKKNMAFGPASQDPGPIGQTGAPG